MSGGERLAECLSEKLGIPSLSREVIVQVANQFGISEALLWEQLEKTKGPSPERRLYLAALQLALAERALQGPFVYHGLAGHFLLKGIPQILKVGIVAPLKFRAEALMRQKNISLDEATRSIQRWDEKSIKWARFLYDVDWLDPSLYDLMVSIAAISVEAACEIVTCALNQQEFGAFMGKEKLIEDFVLASRVKVQLAAHERTKGLDVEVEARAGTVKITGRVLLGGVFPWGGKESIRNDLIEVSKMVPGVEKVLVSLEGTAVPLE
jgi:cytidylate kinase